MSILKWLPTIFIILVWYTYASMGDTKCEKVERAISPITTVLHVAYSVASAWVDSDTELKLLDYEYRGEQFLMKLAAHQFYPDESLPCVIDVYENKNSSSGIESNEVMPERESGIRVIK